MHQTAVAYSEYGGGIWAAALDDPPDKPVLTDDFDYGSLLKERYAVLLIDDDPMVLRMLNRLLKKQADQIYTATSAADAETILRDHTIQFLVCDFDLAPNSPPGTELIERLRRSFPDIEHAVLFTGSAPESVPTAPGIDAVLHKGRDTERLREMIRSAANPIRR